MPQTIDFYKLAHFHNKQIEAWNTLLDPQTKYLLYGGAAYGGKSYFLRWSAIGICLYYFMKYGMRNVQAALFSEDYPTLKDRQIISLKNELSQYPWLGEIKSSRDEGYSLMLTPQYGSGIILFRNLDDTSKYQSAQFAAVFVEELTKNEEEVFDYLRFRLRWPGIDEIKFVGATNPGGIGHGWVKRKWIVPDIRALDHEQDRFRFVSAKYTDNIRNEQYEIQLNSLPTQMRKAYKDGSWEIFAGQFFDEWNPEIHTIRKFIPHNSQMLVGSMDYGRSAPTAIYFATVDKVYFENYDPFFRIRVFAEIYGTKKTPKQWADDIYEKLSFFKLTIKDIDWIKADPSIFHEEMSGSTGISDLFWQEGIKLEEADNDRKQGALMFHNWLSIAPDGFPYLQISRECENAIRTIPELVFKKNDIEDIDTHAEDHAYDSLRYMTRSVRWVEPRGVGAVQQGQTRFYKKPLAWMVGGRQVAVDLNAFRDAHKKSSKVISPAGHR